MPERQDRQLDAALLDLDEALRQGGSTREIVARAQTQAGELGDQVAKAEHCLLLLNAMRQGSASKADAAAVASDAPALSEAGERLGRFVIQRELGHGGAGVVVLAYDPTLQRLIALKLPNVNTLGDLELRRRFLQEGETVARLKHPHILTVYEAGELGPICYIAEEYCTAGTLAEWLARQPTRLSTRRAARLAMLLADAMQYAHSRGVLHRDLKPGNILLEAPADGADGSPDDDVLPFVPKIGDFGLAKVLSSEGGHTRTGMVIGTPQYMAPEQARAARTKGARTPTSTRWG